MAPNKSRRHGKSAAIGLLDAPLVLRDLPIVRLQDAKEESKTERPCQSNRRRNPPTKPRCRRKRAVDCYTVEEVLEVAKSHSRDGSRAIGPRDAAAYLNRITQLSFQDRGESRSLRNRRGEFGAFLGSSLRSLDRYDSKSLATTIQSLAKISNLLEWEDERLYVLWNRLAEHMLHILLMKSECNARHLANSAWGFAKAGQSSKLLFDSIAEAAIPLLEQFQPQELSNVGWAFATAGRSSPALFDEIAEAAVPLLGQFNPQALSNTAWAFATAKHSSPFLFDKIAEAAIPLLHLFKPQNLSNMVWAFATAERSSPLVFNNVAETAAPILHRFNPQQLSNTAWAFATAKHLSPLLFDQVARIAVPLLHRFSPQDLSNTAWAFASAEHSSPSLFDAIAKAALPLLPQFCPRAVTNLVFAFASVGHKHPALLRAAIPAINSRCKEFQTQQLANVAWSYAILDVHAESVFGSPSSFVKVCSSRADDFQVKGLRQLHQWQLWMTERGINVNFPSPLKERCFNAFIKSDTNTSRTQDDVISTLKKMGLDVKVEAQTKIGYSIDAMLNIDGRMIALEVDGPSHFISDSESPKGSTILKQRQIRRLEDIELVSVPYFEWYAIGTVRDLNERSLEQIRYLQKLLGIKSN